MREPSRIEFDATVRKAATGLGLTITGFSLEPGDFPGFCVADLNVADTLNTHRKASPLQAALHRSVMQDVRVGYYQPEKKGDAALLQIDLVTLRD